MGVTCEILIDKPQEGERHKAGKPVSGAVKFAVDKPTVYNDVTLSFLGTGKCSWMEIYRKICYTTKGTETYITQHYNFKNNLKKRQETITLHGVYEHPFKFYLPEDIPSSDYELVSSIVYCVQLKFVKSNFEKVFTAKVPVYGCVDLTTSDGVSVADRPIIFGLEKYLFAPFSKKKPVISLKAEIAKSCVLPGEKVQLSYVVTNHSHVAITAVQADLYYYVTCTSESGKIFDYHNRVEKCVAITPAVPVGEVGKFTCIVPTLPELYSVQCSKIIKREYKIRLIMRLPMPYIDAVVETPLVIGQRKGCAKPCIDEASKQPPSYWEAMCEPK